MHRTDEKYNKDISVIAKTGNFNLPVKKNRAKEYKITDDIVYTCFTSDFLLEEADEWRAEAWKMIKIRSDLNFMFITKRIDRFLISLPDDWGNGYDNVIVGCTCETQERADYRLPIFLSLPIKHRIIICEPLLENIDLANYLSDKITKVVVGGESGNEARICDYAWILNIREQCKNSGVSFWFKQTGAKFRKDSKIYYIKRKLQHSQARKANINLL